MTDAITSDPATIIAGIRQFGLAPDGSDLRDLTAAFDALTRDLAALRAERDADHAVIEREVQNGPYPRDSHAMLRRAILQLQDAEANVARLAEALTVTLRKLEAAHRQLGLWTKDNPIFAKARTALASVEAPQSAARAELTALSQEIGLYDDPAAPPAPGADLSGVLPKSDRGAAEPRHE